VFILDGGYPKWKEEKLPIEYGLERAEFVRPLDWETDEFDYKLDTNKLTVLDELIKENKDREIIDARSEARYNGEVDEPRPTKVRGHIKGAKNVFFKSLVNDKGCFKNKADVEKIFKEQGVNLNAKEIDVYCGSGVTACVDIFALQSILGIDKCKLYNGSWAEAVNYI
jgi:thiosulfate/3-mercaptopyruvate sulfurtransferase